MFSGTGSLILSTGAIITSVWKDDMKNGWGKILCTNGTTIESNPLFINDILISFKETLSKDQCIDEEEYREKIINERKKTENKTTVRLLYRKNL